MFILLLLSFLWSADHHIFFLHGIGGNDQSFGAMPQTIVGDLESRQPEYKVKSHIYSYKTEDKSLTTDDFAKEFDAYMHEKLVGSLKAEDKISFIVHSQGGLVATIWYYHASIESPEFHSEYADRIDSFITLGTPFWGSKIASMYLENPHLGKIMDRLSSKGIIGALGERQLVEMALGSKTIERFRQNTVKLVKNDAARAEIMTSRIRSLNVVGIANFYRMLEEKSNGKSVWFKKLRPFVFGKYHYESDMAVDIPSGNYDSIYYLEDPSKKTNRILFNDKFESKFSRLFIVPAIHASPVADEFFDLAYLPKDCSIDNYCGHPTYEYVLKHMLGGTVEGIHPSMSSKMNEISGYRIQLRVNFPEGTSLEDREMRIARFNLIEGDHPHNLRTPNVPIVFNAFREIMSFAKNEVDDSKGKALTYNITGYIDYMDNDVVGSDHNKLRQNIEARKNGKVLRLAVSTQGFSIKYIDVLVKPTMTTYVELFMNHTPHTKPITSR